MKNTSGFYNVSKVKIKNKSVKGYKTVWEYNVKNKLIQDTIRANNLQVLKIRVLDKGYLWGITDVGKAQKSAKESKNDIKNLTGRFGRQLE